jgi:O-succinylbenzoate synthase
MITFDSAKVLLLDLPLVEPFAAAHGTTSLRSVTVLRLQGEGANGRVTGWGECSALPAATFSAETAFGSFNLLADKIAPLLLGQTYGLDTPLRFDRPDRAVDSPMAAAAVEMAIFDACLRDADSSLAGWLGVTASTVPAGAAVGLGAVDAVVARARSLAEEGYRRLKIKIQPGHDLTVVAALRADSSLADVELHLDANGSFTPDDLDLLTSMAEGVSSLEQPLRPKEIEASAELVRRLDGSEVAVVGDESVPNVEAVHRLAEAGAITGVAIKPPRVGGIRATLEMLTCCRDLGLAATAGGMIETGLGRHPLTALAGLPDFDLIGDLSPAGRWLQADPWPDVEHRGHEMVVPSGPGVAPTPDDDVLAAHTVDRRVLR